MIIWAIFACIPMNGCRAVQPGGYYFGTEIAPTVYDSRAHCQSQIPGMDTDRSDHFDKQGRWHVSSGDFYYICLSHHVDTWTGN